MRDWKNFFTAEDFQLAPSILDPYMIGLPEACAAKANALIQEELEKAKKVYGANSEGRQWSEAGNRYQARIVDIRRVDGT